MKSEAQSTAGNLFIPTVHLDDETTVVCPFCGQTNVISLDWGGASHQHYEEDCQVCCRAWMVHATLDPLGHAQVTIERLEE